MSLENLFQRSTEMAKTLKNVSNDDLGILYGNYKQATLGDNTHDAPFFLQFEATAKWSAWMACKGKTKEEAMKTYIIKTDDLFRRENSMTSHT